MAYASQDARRDLLETLAEATEQLGAALAALGDAYEQLDERNADTLEEELFRPVQAAYGRAKRTHAEFAERHGLPGQTFAPVGRGAPSRGVSGFVEIAIEAIEEAEAILAELQDSMLPVEVGDAPLRAGLAEIRTLVGDLSTRARRFLSLRGR